MENPQGTVDKTYSPIEGYKNEITIIAGIVSCIVGLSMFIASNLCRGAIAVNIEGIYAVLGFSAACFGIGKVIK